MVTGSSATLKKLNLDGSYGPSLGQAGNPKNVRPSPIINAINVKILDNDIRSRDPSDTLKAGICVHPNSYAGAPNGFLIEGNRIHDCGQLPASTCSVRWPWHDRVVHPSVR